MGAKAHKMVRRLLRWLLRVGRRPRQADVGRPAVRPIANAVLLSGSERKKLWGKKVSRKSVKRKQAPVKGLTAVSGPVGSGKTLFGVAQALTWASRGAHVAANISLQVPRRGGGKHRQVLIRVDDETGEIVNLDEVMAAPSVRFVRLIDLSALIVAREEWIASWGELVEALALGQGMERDAAQALAEQAMEWAWLRLPWLFVLADEAALEAAGRDWQNFPSSTAQASTEVRKRKAVIWLCCVEWQKVDSILRDLVGWVWHCEYVPGWALLPQGWSGGCFRVQARRPDWEQKDEEPAEYSDTWRPEQGVIDAYNTHGVVSGLADRLELDRAKMMRRLAKVG